MKALRTTDEEREKSSRKNKTLNNNSIVITLWMSELHILVEYCLGEDDSEMCGRPGYTAVKALLEDVQVNCPQDIRRLFGGPFLREKLALLR